MSSSRPVALVTGASSGIGETFARKLAGRGYDLILVARRLDRLETLKRNLAVSANVEAEALAADLTEEAGLRAVEDRIRDESRLELLVNNAGFGTLGRFFETALDGQVRMHRLHVMAVLRLTRAALEGMVARGRGSVINVSSMAAYFQSPQNVSYCATKAWMNSFTEGLHLELESMNSAVRVQALCPGFTYSEFHDVMGISRETIPAAFWLSADEVVEASLKGLESGDPVVIPGWRYKALFQITRLLPRRLLRASIIRAARKASRVPAKQR